jgi:hypothetical protein
VAHVCLHQHLPGILAQFIAVPILSRSLTTPGYGLVGIGFPLVFCDAHNGLCRKPVTRVGMATLKDKALARLLAYSAKLEKMSPVQ